MNVTKEQLAGLAESIGIDYPALMAFISVESGGIGFSKDTGKIIIQFEPAWFKKKAPFAPSGKWSINKVDVQNQEWFAFNDAFSKNPGAAMESTSIGLGQIMGFHYKTLGFKAVGQMWDHAKDSEYNQVVQMTRFIKSNRVLLKALAVKDWHLVAVNYNGAGYMELAEKYNREPYNTSLKKAYNKYLSV